MRDGQWQLDVPGSTYLFGTRETPTFNVTTPDIGDVDLRVADVDRPRGDGRNFGVDFRGGRTITFDLGVRAHTETDARTEAELLTGLWRGDSVRYTPGSVATLTSQYAGRQRVVYGRPRRFAAVYADVAVNQIVTVTADFVCVDDVFYSADEESTLIRLVPPSGGGLLAPLAAPLATTLSSDRSMAITVVSDLPVWPIIEINGPITNPVVTVADIFTFQVMTSIAEGDKLVIDTRPWVRSALLNGTSLAGAVRGTRLSKASIPPGSYEVGLNGTDETGTATVNLRWRAAYSSL